MQIEEKSFLDKYRFALVGFSRSGKKFGNFLYKTLTAKGLHIYPINPSGGVISGIKTFKDLSDLPVKPQVLIIAVKASSVEKIIHEVMDAGIKRVWIIGSGYTKRVEKLCEDNGIELIHNRCILMYFGGFPHNLHYFMHRMWRKLPRFHPGCLMYDTLGEWVKFRSDIDDSEQQFWMGLPENFNPNEPHVMALYLHQQGSDWSRILTSGMYEFCRKRGIIAVSTDYRGPNSQLHSTALNDVRQIIEIMKQKYDIPTWVSTGVSMGGSASIMLTYLLPYELRPAGIVSVLPVYDIPLFFNETSDSNRTILERSYNGTPETNSEEYDRRSPHVNVGRISPAIPFAIFSGTRDHVVPVEKHGRPLNDALKQNGNSLHYAELDVDHDPDIFTECYTEGLEFVIERMKAKVTGRVVV